MGRPKKLRDRFKIKPYKTSAGKKKFRVSGYMPDGERIREPFEYEADAIKRREELELKVAGLSVSGVLRRTTLSEQEIREAEAAIKLLDGLSLNRAIAEYQSIKERVAAVSGGTVESAIRFFEIHYHPEVTEIGIYEAREEFLEAKVNLSPKTLNQYRDTTQHILQAAHTRYVHQFTVEDLNKIIAKFDNLHTKATLKRGFSVFFNWAVRQRYCKENPCERMEAIRIPLSSVEILSPEKILQLLKAAMEYHNGVMLPIVGIQLFAGLRPSEAQALHVKDVTNSNIRVTEGKMGNITRRSVQIPDVLKRIFKEYPFVGLPKGYRYKLDRLKKATNVDNWVQDVLRHTSISYQMARDEDIGKVATRNGNSERVIRRDYLNVIDDSETIENFWGITLSKIHDTKLEKPMNQLVDRDWPTDSKLAALVKKKPLGVVSEEIGFSHSAIRNRCRKRNIELPGRGYWGRGRMNQD